MPHTYRRGERATQRWLTPVAASGLPDSTTFLRVVQEGNLFFAALSPFVSGPQISDEPHSEGTFELTVERDGKVLGTAPEADVGYEVEPVAADYRISLDARRELPWWRHSARVQSEWTFRSAGGEQETMPLVLADLTVPAADATSRVRAGRPVEVVLGLRHQAGSARTGFQPPKLEMSYDGKDWTTLPLRPAGTNRFVAPVNHPESRAGQVVHLRLDAQDHSGGRLRQEITSAYALK